MFGPSAVGAGVMALLHNGCVRAHAMPELSPQEPRPAAGHRLRASLASLHPEIRFRIGNDPSVTPTRKNTDLETEGVWGSILNGY